MNAGFFVVGILVLVVGVVLFVRNWSDTESSLAFGFIGMIAGVAAITLSFVVGQSNEAANKNGLELKRLLAERGFGGYYLRTSGAKPLSVGTKYSAAVDPNNLVHDKMTYAFWPYFEPRSGCAVPLNVILAVREDGSLAALTWNDDLHPKLVSLTHATLAQHKLILSRCYEQWRKAQTLPPT